MFKKMFKNKYSQEKVTGVLAQAGLRAPNYFYGDISVKELWQFLESQGYTVVRGKGFIPVSQNEEERGFFVGGSNTANFVIYYAENLDDCLHLKADDVAWLAKII